MKIKTKKESKTNSIHVYSAPSRLEVRQLTASNNLHQEIYGWHIWLIYAIGLQLNNYQTQKSRLRTAISSDQEKRYCMICCVGHLRVWIIMDNAQMMRHRIRTCMMHCYNSANAYKICKTDADWIQEIKWDLMP